MRRPYGGGAGRQSRLAIECSRIRMVPRPAAPTLPHVSVLLLEGMDSMGIIAWIVLGLLAGAIAKAVLPGDDPGGIIVTMIIGIVGAVIGGLIGEWVGFGGLSSFFDLRTWILAVAGSVLLLLLYRLVSHEHHHHGHRPLAD
jgi:uncharacterized membrane protein YeaQ/YmgE (transglycosylase-associated protein family)